MHMNDLTLNELKRNHAQSKSCAERSKLNGLHGTDGYYSRMAEALQARINELEAACGVCRPLYTSPPAQTQKDTVGPSGDRLSDFRVDQWWFLELDKAFKNGTAEQKQAVAVVRNLLATIQTHLQEPPTE